jgi:phage-related protein
MTNMVNSGDVYGRAGQWLIGTAKRNPEALLVLAAGCALLMRGRAGSSQSASTQSSGESAGADGRWQLSRATEKASDAVSDLKDRVTDVTSSVSDYAGGVGRIISAQTSQMVGQAQSTLQTGFGHLLREQPLAVVAFGLAAGAAVAALLPATEMEERSLAPARDAIAGVTGKMGENLIAAASDAGQQLSQGIAERVSEGFKELVHEVGEKFTDKVAGKTESVLPSNVASAPSRVS